MSNGNASVKRAQRDLRDVRADLRNWRLLWAGMWPLLALCAWCIYKAADGAIGADTKVMYGLLPFLGIPGVIACFAWLVTTKKLSKAKDAIEDAEEAWAAAVQRSLEEAP